MDEVNVLICYPGWGGGGGGGGGVIAGKGNRYLTFYG